jgi:uncharacterized radical SAM superfamily Fe-S cluster-containing enzyme
MVSAPALDHRRLYRLPWTLPDNAISWLEPTSACNLACDGCYRENIADSHKPLDVVKREIDTFHRLRNADGISISGGDPLMHPDIVGIVRYIAGLGLKPIVNTNGQRLTRSCCGDQGGRRLRLHLSHRRKQGARVEGQKQVELNELRLSFADVGRVGSSSLQFHGVRGHAAYTPELWPGRRSTTSCR